MDALETARFIDATTKGLPEKVLKEMCMLHELLGVSANGVPMEDAPTAPAGDRSPEELELALASAVSVASAPVDSQEVFMEWGNHNTEDDDAALGRMFKERLAKRHRPY